MSEWSATIKLRTRHYLPDTQSLSLDITNELRAYYYSNGGGRGAAATATAVCMTSPTLEKEKIEELFTNARDQHRERSVQIYQECEYDEYTITREDSTGICPQGINWRSQRTDRNTWRPVTTDSGAPNSQARQGRQKWGQYPGAWLTGAQKTQKG